MRASDGAMLIVALGICWSLYRANRDIEGFNLIDLIMENGRVSKIAFAFLVSLAATTWVMIRLTIDGKMSDLIYAGYGAMWVAPVVAKLFSAPMTTTTTASSSSTTVTKEAPAAKEKK